jgi:hypothetical protein
MANADRTSPYLQARQADEFWAAVKWALSFVFQVDPMLAEQYRIDLEDKHIDDTKEKREWREKRGPFEFGRLLSLHDDPLDVAAALAEVRPTREHIKRYDAYRFVNEKQDTAASSDEWAVASPYYVTHTELCEFLVKLNYQPHTGGAWYIWTQRDGLRPGNRLPPISTAVYFRLRSGEAVYDRQQVFELFENLLSTAVNNEVDGRTIGRIRALKDRILHQR